MPIPIDGLGVRRVRARLSFGALMAAIALPLPAAALDLSLGDALARAAAFDPAQPAAGARVEAAAAAARQASIKPAPTLALDIENFTGSGPYSLLDRSETTLSYAQTLERQDKREARVGRSRAEVEVVRARSVVSRLDMLRDVQAAYAEALAADAELLVAEARLVAAQASQRDIARRVKSARDPLFAGSRADATTAQAEIARDRARDFLRASRDALAAFWGGKGDFTLKLDDFFNVAPPADLPPGGAPDLALLEAERDMAIAAVRLEQSRGVADPTVRAGLRYFGQGGDAALVVGGSIPLGVRAANRANVERALAERVAAEAEITAAAMTRAREIARRLTRLRALALESERIRTEVIPHAIRAVEQVTAGFNRGGFEYLDVTEAERALADARARRVEVLREFHTGLTTLDRLTGKHRALAATSSMERR